MRALGFVACTAIACGSSDAPSVPLDETGFPADDPTSATTGALSASLARNITINQISAFQVVEVPLAQNGAPADRTIAGTTSTTTCQTTADCFQLKECSKSGQCLTAVKLIAKRPALLRIFVTPGAGWQPTKLTARVKIRFYGPVGAETRVVSTTKLVTATPSTMADLDSTINVDLPADALEPSAMFGVVLNQVGGDAATPKSTARYPVDGSLDDLAVVGGGDVMHLLLVPMSTQGAPSPDTSPAKLKSISDRFMQLFPVASVDIRVHAPYTWAGGSNDQALMEMNNLRSKESAGSDVYYYGALNGAGGGLSGLGTAASVGDDDPEVIAHEVGHAHGLQHAPFCNAPGTPPNYWPTDASHADGHLGRWVYDPLAKRMIDPMSLTDIMSYCPAKWISDFHYMYTFQRVRGDNRFYAYRDAPVGPDDAPPFRGLYVRADGSTVWDDHVTTRAWVTRGEPQSVDAINANGVERLHGYWFPYDHQSGGLLMVPESALANAITLEAPAIGAPIVVRH